MIIFRFRKTNHQAVFGFLLPFIAAGAVSFIVLSSRGGPFSQLSLILFVTLIPLILITGLVSSLRSIPRIRDLGDKDYAYSGLTLNIFFIVIYTISLIYCLSMPSS